MRKSIALMAFLVFAIASRNAGAGDLAHDIVLATKLGAQLTESREACKANEQAGEIEGIAAASPAMFHEINSRSARWSDARAAYLRYAISTCVPQNIESYVELAASLYENALSEKEMSAVLKFYESDVGKKFVEVSSRLSSTLNKKMYEESLKVREEGGMRFEAEMQQISGASQKSKN